MKILFATVALCVALSQVEAEYKTNYHVYDDNDRSNIMVDKTEPGHRIFGFGNDLEADIDSWTRGLSQQIKVLTRTAESFMEDFKSYAMDSLVQLRDALKDYGFYNLASLADEVRKFVHKNFRRSFDHEEPVRTRRTKSTNRRA
ncbi:uncharacterized protein LOC124182513 [Neodiprion fabricii]|uniref:uncharacterized protein LOC124182513 n=1 Tax=Neodiprion fabricii TaxID=2872261 RepID=UPI001ED930B4|nr:uncharacterized protein LOC124182513 [Neodiprion fabricii]